MTLEEILATSMDLAGGEMIAGKLDAHFATGILLNVVDGLEIELAQSPRNIAGIKETLTLAADVDTGSFAGTGVLGIKFARWRRVATDRWTVLDIVDDIDALTRSGREARHAIMFVGADKAAQTYYLSFTPKEAITVELWGRSIGATAASVVEGSAGGDLGLSTNTFLPQEFGMHAAYRIADFLLNQLLLLNPAYQAFVIAQKASIGREASRWEFQWNRYRTMWSDGQGTATATEFNVLDHLGIDGEFDSMPSPAGTFDGDTDTDGGFLG